MENESCMTHRRSATGGRWVGEHVLRGWRATRGPRGGHPVRQAAERPQDAGDVRPTSALLWCNGGPALYQPRRAVGPALLRVYAYRVLIGACNPMRWPLWPCFGPIRTWLSALSHPSRCGICSVCTHAWGDELVLTVQYYGLPTVIPSLGSTHWRSAGGRCSHSTSRRGWGSSSTVFFSSWQGEL